jgi:hypothetical protein
LLCGDDADEVCSRCEARVWPSQCTAAQTERRWKLRGTSTPRQLVTLREVMGADRSPQPVRKLADTKSASAPCLRPRVVRVRTTSASAECLRLGVFASVECLRPLRVCVCAASASVPRLRLPCVRACRASSSVECLRPLRVRVRSASASAGCLRLCRVRIRGVSASASAGMWTVRVWAPSASGSRPHPPSVRRMSASASAPRPAARHRHTSSVRNRRASEGYLRPSGEPSGPRRVVPLPRRASLRGRARCLSTRPA